MTGISQPLGIRQTLNLNGNTTDIVKAILYADRFDKSDVSGLAASLKGATTLETCANIWDFIKKNITYKIDPNGQQFIKSPAKLWHDKSGDCKSFSIFYASILKALKIPYKYRFASYTASKIDFTHVYVIAAGGIVCDAVMNEFNTEKQFNYNKDFDMTKISYMGSVAAPATAKDIAARAAALNAVVNFEDFKDLAELIAVAEPLPVIKLSNLTSRLEVSKEDVIRLLKEAQGRFISNEFKIGSLGSWLKGAFNTVNTWCNEHLKISLGEITLILGGIGTGGLLGGLGVLGGTWLRPLISGIGAGTNGGILLTGDGAAIALLSRTDLTDEEAEQKRLLLINIGNALLAESVILSSNVIQNKAASLGLTSNIKLIKESVTTVDKPIKDSFLKTEESAAVAGLNFSSNDNFYESVLQSLKLGFPNAGNPTSADFYEWKNFRIGGGVGNCVNTLIYIVNNLPLQNGKVLGLDYNQLFLRNIVSRIAQDGYKGQQTSAAGRLFIYMFNAPNGGDVVINLPSGASRDLALGASTPADTILNQADVLLNQGATTLTIYNLLTGGGMSSNSALAYLVSKGRSVVNILQGANYKTDPNGGGVVTPPATSNSNSLLTYGGIALLAFKILS